MFLNLPASNLFELIELSFKVDWAIFALCILPIALITLTIWAITWIVSKRIG